MVQSSSTSTWLSWLLGGLVGLVALAGLGLYLINLPTPVPATWGIAAGLRNTPTVITYKLLSTVIYTLLTAWLGLLIIRRMPRHPIGWLLYAAGLANGLVNLNDELTVYGTFTEPSSFGPLSALIMNWSWITPFSLYFWMMAIFPEGRLPSPRWRWVLALILGMTATMIAAALVEASMTSAYGLPNPLPVAAWQPLQETFFSLSILLMGLLAPAVLALIAARFNRTQGEARQQMKWLVGAISLTAAAILAGILFRFILNYPFGEHLFNFSLIFLPVAIGIAVLRYRLYEIDLIIRGTLIYGILVAGLALIYGGTVALLQLLSQALTGPQSNLVVVVITLLIAALFNPVRRRVQGFIDRRFYREKIDARQALVAFAREVRTLIELPALLHALVGRTTALLHITHGAVFLTTESETGPEFRLVEAHHLPVTMDRLTLDSASRLRLQSGQTIARPHDKTFPLLVPLIAPAGLADSAASPAEYDPPAKPEILIGLLALGPRRSEQDYSREDQALLTGLADQAGTAIYVAQLIEEKEAEVRRREASERQLLAYRHSPAGRAEATAQALLSEPAVALIELHRLVQRAETDPETAALLEPLPAALTAAAAPLLAGLAEGYRYLFSARQAPEVLSAGLRELTGHLAQPAAVALNGAGPGLALYQLCQQALAVDSISKIVALLPALKIQTPASAPFLLDLHLALQRLSGVAEALHAYERVETAQDKLSYLAGAVERLSHVDHLARTELGAADRAAVQRIATNWLGVVTGAMSELQSRARLACRLLTRHTWSGEIISLTLAVRNEGQGAALNLAVSLTPAPEYTLLDEAGTSERLAAGEEWQLQLRVRPRLAQGVSQFRAHFALRYDDTHGSNQLEHFADVVHLLIDAGEFQFISNPYVVGTPLQTGSPLFFGREDVLCFIKENLAAAHRNNLVLIGQRRTGKTSLLKQLPAHLGQGYLPVYLDGQSLALDPGLPNFFFSLATEITFALEDQDIFLEKALELADFAGSPAATFERTFLPAVQQAIDQRHLLLLLDEFEELEAAVRRGNIDASIFGFLRHLIQHTPNLSVIFCGTHRIEALAADYWSVLFNISLYQHVAFLSQAEALRLIQEPVAVYNMRYDDLALDKMWRVTAGHPYFLQLLCHNLVNRHNKQQQNYVTVADVNAALAEILAAGEAHFVYLWTESSREERLILTALSRMMPLSGRATPVQVSDYLAEHGVPLARAAVSQALHQLVLRDALRPQGGSGSEPVESYGWQLGLLGLWVEKYKSLSRVVDESR